MTTNTTEAGAARKPIGQTAALSTLAATTDAETTLLAVQNTSEPVTTAKSEQPAVKQVQALGANDPLKAAEDAAKNAVENKAADDDVLYMFVSRWQSLTIYVGVGELAQRYDFKNGVLQANKDLAVKLRQHRDFNKRFNEVQSMQKAELRRQLAAQQARMKSATFAGPDASSNGADGVYVAQQRALLGAEAQLMTDIEGELPVSKVDLG